MDNVYLVHHGTKGMRWGIRRYQNKDGSLTPAGKKRQRKLEQRAIDSEKNIEKKKQRILKSRSAAELYRNAHLFSDNELQSAYNRLSLERNILNLTPKEVNKGKQIAQEVTDWGRKVNDLTEVGMRTYNNIAKLYNTFSESEKKYKLISGNDNKK